MTGRENAISKNATATRKVNGHGMQNASAFVIDFISERNVDENHNIGYY